MFKVYAIESLIKGRIIKLNAFIKYLKTRKQNEK